MQIKGYSNKMLASSFIFKFYVLQLFLNNAFGSHHMEKRMVLETCLGQFEVHQNTIIRTGESMTLGGKYLEGVALDTMEECQRLCCETESCDVYIFEAKSDGFCYLFGCGPPENFHCKFTRHANYTSAVLMKQRESATTTAASFADNSISQQEIELTSLKSKPKIPQVNQKDEKVAEALSNMAAKKAQTTLNPVSTLPQCGRFQFGCHSGECIAVYNACDGIPQCADGSDEGPECSGAPANLAGKSNIGSNEAPNSNNNKNNVIAQTTAATVPKKSTQPKKAKQPEDDLRNRKMVAEIQNQLASNSDLTLLDQKTKHIPRVVHLKNSKPIHTISQTEPAQPGDPNTPPLADIYVGPITREDGVMSADIVFGAHYIPKPGVMRTPYVPAEQPKTVKPQKPETTSTTPAAEVQNTNIPQETETPKENKIEQSPPQVIPKAAADDDDDDDYDERVTEPPKKWAKNRKQKPKVDDLESDNQPHTPQQPHKEIHENLGLEFHDHDGHAERPGGAMISLTLGLLVTAALAIVIGCRMRTVRRRIRRPGGKGFAHDSDFLVNGMYL